MAALKPLHVNSGRHYREFRVGRYMCALNLAEDPSEPWWCRYWCDVDPDGDRVDRFLVFERIHHESAAAGMITLFSLNIGPLSVFWGRLNG